MPTLIDYNLNATTGLREPRPAAPKRPDPCADDKPVCPACGGLQCLCRPRFFPGQLLTDEDLNRLERYVIDKNKLHARYLHGWGVACGLEVVCDACTASNVVVRTGYALSPCGDDIIVCNDQSVNVCELIDQCRPQTGVQCENTYQQKPRECKDGAEQWVLAICYDERPSRGITALTGSTDSACCSSCGCGGSGSCGCKTSSKPDSVSVSKSKKSYKPQCEPTQICEGYRFTAYKKPPQTKPAAPGRLAGANMDLLFAWMYANRAKFGPLLERVLCCVTAALELRASFGEGKYTQGRQAADAYRDYLEALRDFAAGFALHNCTFVDKLAAQTKDTGAQIEGLRGLSALTDSHKTLVSSGMQRLDQTLFDLIAECFCSALLPACPEPAADNCVPLAVVTVRTRDCHVVEICNWEARKLLITWRTVGYWLSWLPWGKLRETIAKLCCADEPRRTIIWPLMLIIGMVMKQARTSAPASGLSAEEERRRAAAMSGRGITPIAATVAPAAGAAPAAVPAPATDAAPAAGTAPATGAAGTNKPFAGDALERALASDNLLAHLAEGFDRLRTGADEEAPEWASLVARFADGSALAPLAGVAAIDKTRIDDFKSQVGIDELHRQVAELRATLADYQPALDALKNLAKGRV